MFKIFDFCTMVNRFYKRMCNDFIKLPLYSFKYKEGFTLVEMAVVVAIMAVLMAMGLATATSVMQNTQRTATKEKLAFAKDALIAYFLTNKQLPCPDTGSNVGNTGRDGLENRTAGNCTAGIGTVPYLSLGISRSQALDGYGNFITYRLDTVQNWHLTATFPAPSVPPPVPPAVPDCLINGITTNPVGLTVNSAVAIPDVKVAAAVLISHGANGWGAWNQGNTNASQNIAPVTPAEFANTQLNSAATDAYRNYVYSDAVADPFDDIVQFFTAAELTMVAVKVGKSNICS